MSPRNRAVLVISMLTSVLLLVAGCSGDSSGEDSGESPDTSDAAPKTVIEVPLDEPTVQEPTPQSSEELRRAQRELDAQCAQMDIQEAQEMGMAPEEYGCETDGTGIPVREWLDRGEQ